MATHSSVLAWRIPETGEPGGLPSMGRTESNMTEKTQQQQQSINICAFINVLDIKKTQLTVPSQIWASLMTQQ